MKDLFSDGTSSAAAKSLDSVADQKIRDFCHKFGIDFEPISGMFSHLPLTDVNSDHVVLCLL